MAQPPSWFRAGWVVPDCRALEQPVSGRVDTVNRCRPITGRFRTDRLEVPPMADFSVIFILAIFTLGAGVGIGAAQLWQVRKDKQRNTHTALADHAQEPKS
jgi:hypothetical protein